MSIHITPFKRLLCICLSVLTVLCAAACANGGNPEESQSGSGTGTVTSTGGEETETEKTWLDNLPETMDFGGDTVTFLSAEEEKSIELTDEDNTGDVVNEAYWKRTTSLEDRLNVTIRLGEKTGYGSFNSVATQAITSGTGDYDIFCGHTRFNVSIAATGYLLDLRKNGFTDIIDITAPYWSQLYTNNVNYQDNLFWLAGDMTENFIAYIYAMFVNATVWNNTYPGESIYDVVLEGNWTLDKMSELAEGTYRDLNGNSEQDDNDQYGVIMQKGHTLNGMVFASGVTYTGIDDAGNYSIVLNSEHTVDVFNKLHTIFYATDWGRMLENSAFDNLAVTMFTEDRLLFCPYTFLFSSNETVREMESDFYVIPLPKYDAEQEDYRVNQYDGVPIYGVPTTLSPERFEMIATVLEADCSMTSKIVIPAYYDLALKNKYSRDATTAQMIDLIHEKITGDFCFLWGDSLGGLMNFFYDNIQNEEIASKFKTSEKLWAAAMKKLLAKLES